MSYRPHPPSGPLLIGYDPERDLPADHLARLVEQVVEASVTPPRRPAGPGQPPFDPRLPLKVLVYGYATGQRSSRQLERLGAESLPYLFLTRGDTPSYRTLCTVRVEQCELLEQVWVGLLAVAQACGMARVGHLVVDSTKLRADASPEAVLKAGEYEPMREELGRILAEAAQVDAKETAEGAPGATRLGAAVPPEQMREIVRRVRRRLARAQRDGSGPKEPPAGGAAPGGGSSPPGSAPASGGAAPGVGARARGGARPLGPQMMGRLQAGLAAIEGAMTEGRQHLCLTDPEARMMGGGRERKVRECYSFEVAVDAGAGLLVVGQVSQAASDNERLEAVVGAAAPYEPAGVQAVTADSGFYGGGPVGRLLEAGIDLCVPDSNTAGDLHRGQPVGTVRAAGRGQVVFAYDPVTDQYRCPEGNRLERHQVREQAGQEWTVYKAQQACRGCPRAGECLTQRSAQYRTLKVGKQHAALEAARQRFNEPQHQERYRHRGEQVETVFGVLRGTLGYPRFRLRGLGRVTQEARLMALGYQLRKVVGRWATG
jgi:hypothetical protein